MRFLLIAAAILAIFALIPTDAMAAGHGRDVQIINNNYVVNDGYYGGRNYGYDRRGYYDDCYRYRSFQGHNEAVARIQAMHSPYRRTTHPLSAYNDPPVYYYGPRW